MTDATKAGDETLPVGLSELVLIVADIPAAAAFYRDCVGLIPCTPETDTWAWFWAGDLGQAQRLALRRGPLLFEEHSPLPAGRRFGPVHFALSVPRAQLKGAVERLRSAGVKVHGPTRLEWMRAESYYFHDPDANLVEFWSPDDHY